MRERYEPAAFEQKWRDRWKSADLFKTREEPGRPKFYGLDFFPYPSGAGLSVGHCRNYIPTDVLCRMKTMQGYNVLHPMGFDAFGLPAENEAIKNKRKPEAMVHEYGATYRRQMELIGVGYDWSRSFFSSDPDYYRWTQWCFKLLYERGLAYRRMADVNWCPKDKTALANEEVVGGLCERCGTPVEKRAIPQWFFRITDYAQRLIDDLDDVDWPEGIKNMQRNWIGRSEGVEFEMDVVFSGDVAEAEAFEVVEKKPKIRVFTTRMDTVYGMTFCVLAPEHPLVEKIKANVDAGHQVAVAEYQTSAKALSDMDRQATTREKTGVFTGAYAVNPVNKKRVPIYVADYVLMGYGTGAIMAVPGHDDRDFDFAVKYGLDVIPVIQPDEAYLRGFHKDGDFDYEQALSSYLSEPTKYYPPFVSKEARLVNSGSHNGMTPAAATASLGQWVEGEGIGERKVNYKLRDWLISRQRYWGCPIPVVYDKNGDMDLVPDNQLPVELPDVDHYEPSDDGSSPLSRITEFVNCTTPDGTLGRRETDTMGGFACSSWYFLRFADPHNDKEAWDLKKAEYWMPVDCYVGGAEHAVMHLLYARFWTKVFFDAGLVSVKEPFQRLMNQGQVLGYTPYRQPREGETLGVGEDGVLVSFKEAATIPEEDLMWRWVRMSKSKGNVVTPEEAVENYGADALRVYELFVAPFEQNVQWTNEGMAGAVRFLSRVFDLAGKLEPWWDPMWSMQIGNVEATELSRSIRRATHKFVAKATADIEGFAFNTYISSAMITVNTLGDLVKAAKEPGEAEKLAFSEALEYLVKTLSPVAPHTADEIWESLGGEGFTYDLSWPPHDPDLARDDTVTIAIQVNGKLRDTMEAAADAPQDAVQDAALARDKIQPFLEGKTVRKVIVVPGKLVNIVVS